MRHADLIAGPQDIEALARARELTNRREVGEAQLEPPED
jgi:hypothetical protein